MEHTVHLGAKAFIETLYPSKSTKKAKGSDETDNGDTGDNEGNEAEDNGEEDWTVDWDDLPEGEEVDEPVDFEPGDLLGKMLGLINQVNTILLYEA